MYFFFILSNSSVKDYSTSSINFNEVNGLKTYKAVIFGEGQFDPATGATSSKKMARFVWRGAGNGVSWQQAIKYATQLVNGQTITGAANVTNQVYYRGYTSSWSASGKKDIIYSPRSSLHSSTSECQSRGHHDDGSLISWPNHLRIGYQQIPAQEAVNRRRADSIVAIGLKINETIVFVIVGVEVDLGGGMMLQDILINSEQRAFLR